MMEVKAVPEIILVRYGEIALKGKNRRFFEQALWDNLESALYGLDAAVSRLHGRFLVSGQGREKQEIINRLSRVFGVTSLSAVQTAPLDPGAIEEETLKLVKDRAQQEKSFRIKARRSNKKFPLTSPELNRVIGAAVLRRNPHLEVSLDHPSFTVSIEIGHREAFIFSDQVAGPGGLPVGVTGRALLLLSGGIDSPVAGWMAMKRGLELEAVHFHSYPFTSARAQDKAIDLCKRLAAPGIPLKLHQISVTEIQKEIRDRCPPSLSIILLRRMMLRLAEALSKQRQLQALVTGESLGQVASQTLESMQVISSVTPLLILRPLIGMDKQEIVTRAEEIGTYEISIRPYEDCCTLFVPQRPATRPGASRVEKAEAALDVNRLTRAALDTVETRVIG